MPALFIKYDDYKKKYKLNPPSSPKGFSIGVIIVKKKHYYILYNEKREICVLSSELVEVLRDILNALFSSLSNNMTLWISVSIEDPKFSKLIENIAENGFNSPFMTNLSPLRVSITPSIAFVRQNMPTEEYSKISTLNKVYDAIKQYKNGDKSCSITACLSKKALSFLRKTSKIGISDDGSQKELSGELYVGNVIKKGGEFIYVIEVNESSVESGQEEDVDVLATRYNFHSHPEQAYIRHSVDNAWPSLTDYLGYLKLGINTVFHCVATLEGVYIMSFGSKWANNLKKVDRNFIMKNYHIDHKEKYTPKSYVKKVNGIKYKGYPIYNVQFFPWEKAGKKFKVSYAKIGISCITTEKGSRVYKKLYS